MPITLDTSVKDFAEKLMTMKPTHEWRYYRLAYQVTIDRKIIHEDDCVEQLIHTCPCLTMLWVWSEDSELNDDVVTTYIILFLMELYIYILNMIPEFRCRRWGRLSSMEWVAFTGMAAQMAESLERYDSSAQLNISMMKDFFYKITYVTARKGSDTCK